MFMSVSLKAFSYKHINSDSLQKCAGQTRRVFGVFMNTFIVFKEYYIIERFVHVIYHYKANFQ